METASRKAALRIAWRSWRAAQRPELRRHDIATAASHLLSNPAFAAAATIAVYAALPDEPDLSPVMEAAWRAGKRVALPVVVRRDHPLAWRAHLPTAPLVTGSFRVPIPPEGAPAVGPETIDLVVVPALAVDPRGYRIGYGGGYYDRSLPLLTRARRVWLGQSPQIVDSVPNDDFDQPVHELITELGTARAVAG